MNILIDMLDDFSTFLFDGDGVLYKESEPLDGAIAFLKLLSEKQKQVFILTNNSTKTREDFQLKLKNMGIVISTENILTSSYLTARYMANNIPNANIYVIGEEGLKSELRAVGLNVLNNWKESLDEDIFDFDFAKVDCLVIGMDRTLNYTKITRAVHLLQNYDHIRFIATNADFTFPTVKGLILGGGAMIKILEELSGRKIELIIGKPEPEMYKSAVQLANSTIENTIMFGDRIETDILGANRLGMDTCLVMTGVTQMSDLGTLTEETAPTIILNSLQDALTSMEKNQ